MILRAQTNFVEFLEQVLEVLKEVEIDKTECSTLLASIQKQACDTRCGEFQRRQKHAIKPLFRQQRFAYRYHARDFFSH
ncbi:hypothetical protein JT116_02310 [Helicobacter pylori]|nr:hypothetical protein [Helicobacter pylori]